MKHILTILLTFLPWVLPAQTAEPMAGKASSDTAMAIRPSLICFGYLSYDATMKVMPEYQDAQQELKTKREAFEQEMQRVEDDFNQKYESFLEGQKEFPRTILLKRQNELRELMQRNLEFKAQARQELQDTEASLMVPVHARLNEVLAEIAKEYGLALVINTDSNACPFIDPRMGMNIQTEVIEYLKK